MVDQGLAEWCCKFSKVQGSKEIVSLTGNTSANLWLLKNGDVIVCTPTQLSVEISQWLCKVRFGAERIKTKAKNNNSLCANVLFVLRVDLKKSMSI